MPSPMSSSKTISRTVDSSRTHAQLLENFQHTNINIQAKLINRNNQTPTNTHTQLTQTHTNQQQQQQYVGASAMMTIQLEIFTAIDNIKIARNKKILLL